MAAVKNSLTKPSSDFGVDPQNEFKPNKAIGAEMVSTRQAQEVQAAMIVAKRFPRDENAAYDRIMRACERKSLAEQAIYEYPKGGQKVTGPSIRLAEAIAQNWGNLDFGIVELEQNDGESTMMSYAWDLETNTRRTIIFSVKHWRDTKSGGYALTDSRDVYEIAANMGARRMRACILAVVPGDVIDAAVDKCYKTLQSGNTTPLVDRIRDMISAFREVFQVSKEMLESFVGCNSTAFSENDFIRLKNIYKSLRDGMASREDYFSADAMAKEPEQTPSTAGESELPETSQPGSEETDPLA